MANGGCLFPPMRGPGSALLPITTLSCTPCWKLLRAGAWAGGERKSPVQQGHARRRLLDWFREACVVAAGPQVAARWWGACWSVLCQGPVGCGLGCPPIYLTPSLRTMHSDLPAGPPACGQLFSAAGPLPLLCPVPDSLRPDRS